MLQLVFLTALALLQGQQAYLTSVICRVKAKLKLGAVFE